MEFFNSYTNARAALREAENITQMHLLPSKKIVMITVADLRNLLDALEYKVDKILDDYVKSKGESFTGATPEPVGPIK